MKLTFWSGVGTVTGANFLLESGNFRALVDCGIVQGLPEQEVVNGKDFPYDPASIQYLFITHAHMDHIGRVPKLVKDGFKGTIYSTEATKALAELMLTDSARLMNPVRNNPPTSAGAISNGVNDLAPEPLYTLEDVQKAMALWQSISYHVETLITPNVKVVLKDAGHILGSAMYLFAVLEDGKSKTILFTGDSGNSPSLLLPDTEFVTDADTVVLDSVYGDRNHESKEARDATFEATVKKVIERRGTLLIPTFSIERTQTMLFVLHNLFAEGTLPKVPVYLDSPLAIKVTKIYESIKDLYKPAVEDEMKLGDIFMFPKLIETSQSRDSREIQQVPPPKIILAGSGMSSGGRIVSHEAIYLPDANNCLMLIGYQAVGTLGRQLEEGAKEVTIAGETVPVRAEVISIDGYSGHKDSDHLVEFAEHCEPRTNQFFIVMGEPKSSMFLAQRLNGEGMNAKVPERGIVYEL